MVIGKVVKGPGVEASGSLVCVLADESSELVGLGGVGDGDATSIKVALESAPGPRVDGLVERILGSQGSAVGGLGILVASVGSSSAVGGRSRGRDGVAQNLGAVLANKGTQLVDLAAVGNYGELARRIQTRHSERRSGITYR